MIALTVAGRRRQKPELFPYKWINQQILQDISKTEILYDSPLDTRKQTKAKMSKIRKLFSFSQTAKRAEFLQVIAISMGLWLLAAYVDEVFLAPNLCLINENWECYLPGQVRDGLTLDMLMFAFILVLLIAVIIRRLNSHKRSPLYTMMAVPLICLLIIFLYFPEMELATWQTIVSTLLFLPLLYWLLVGGKSAD